MMGLMGTGTSFTNMDAMSLFLPENISTVYELVHVLTVLMAESSSCQGPLYLAVGRADSIKLSVTTASLGDANKF